MLPSGIPLPLPPLRELERILDEVDNSLSYPKGDGQIVHKLWNYCNVALRP